MREVELHRAPSDRRTFQEPTAVANGAVSDDSDRIPSRYDGSTWLNVLHCHGTQRLIAGERINAIKVALAVPNTLSNRLIVSTGWFVEDAPAVQCHRRLPVNLERYLTININDVADDPTGMGVDTPALARYQRDSVGPRSGQSGR